MRIVSLAVAVPKSYLDISDIESKFGKKTAKKISMITGIKKRHISNGNVGALELMLEASREAIKKSDGSLNFDAILVVTQTPEYKFPSTACILQDSLNISKDCLAYDINLGCSGYTYGLITANAFISSQMFRRILLIVGDLTNLTASDQDSSTYPLFADAYSATIIEESQGSNKLLGTSFGTDGSGKNNLITYVGGSRYKTEKEYQQSVRDGIEMPVQYPSYVYMNGEEIFDFCSKVVPKMLNNLFEKTNLNIEDIDYFILHQANQFIINHVMNKLKLPQEKVPTSLELFGNTSGASIPLTLCHHFGESKSDEDLCFALLGFGVGYSWAGVIVNISPGMIQSIRYV